MTRDSISGFFSPPEAFIEFTSSEMLLICPFSLCRRAHTVTVLFILTCALVYVTLLEETPQDTAYNTKRSVGRTRHFLHCPQSQKPCRNQQAVRNIPLDPLWPFD